MHCRTLVVSVCLSVLVSAGRAQEATPAPTAAASPYRLFNVVSGAEVMDKLNQYGAAGYRFLGMSSAEGGATSVLMEKAEGAYEYAFAAGGLRHQQFQAALNDAGARGFYCVPHSVSVTLKPGLLALPEFSALMEKVAGGKDTYEFKIVSPMTKSNLEKDLALAAADGFLPMGMATSGVHVVVTQHATGRIKPASAPEAGRFQLLTTGNLKEREAKLQDAAAAGYRIVVSEYRARPGQDHEFIALFERAPSPPEYKLLTNDVQMKKETADQVAAEQLAEFQKQLNEAAAAGYRVADGPTARIHFKGWAKPWRELSAVLEKTSGQTYEYQILEADGTPALSKRIAEAAAHGFRVPSRGLLTGDMAFVERIVSAK